MPLRMLAGIGACMFALLALLHIATRWSVEPPAEPVSSVVREPVPATEPVRAVHPQQTRYWQDPSIDPEVLKRAYAPPSRRLLPEDRPSAASIQPDAEALKALGLVPDAN